MGSVFKFLMLQCIGFNTIKPAVLEFTCPEGVMRVYRSKMFCADEKQYHCLYDTNKNEYVEECIDAGPFGEGKYAVFSGNLDARDCDEPFYSPYAENPVLSNDGHRCYFLKSLCNEEGQVAVSNGSSSTDRCCRCDYTRGYDYVTKPIDPCKCSPSTEDCSCFIRLCPRRNDKLNQDYGCEDKKPEEYKCSTIVSQGMTPTVSTDLRRDTCKDCDAKSTFETTTRPVTKAWLSLAAVVLLILILSVVSICVKYNRFILPRPRDIYHQSHDMYVVSYFEETKQISEMKKAFKRRNRDKIVILLGLSGSGKTQAAHYYCQEEGKNYSIVAKINATDKYSLLNTLRDLVFNIGAETLHEDRCAITSNIMCNQVKTFLNEKGRSRFRYLFLVDDVRVDKGEIDSVLSLVKEVKNLDMIVTTNDSTFEGNDIKALPIKFNGMKRKEYMKLLRRNERGLPMELSEESITDLINVTGTLPLFVNSARKYLIATNKTVPEYLETMKGLEQTTVIYSVRLPLRDMKRTIEKRNKVWEVMMLLPFLQYESVSTTVLEACYFHLTKCGDFEIADAIESLMDECQKYSLCNVIEAPKSRFEFPDDDPNMSKSKSKYLIFHEVIMLALRDQEFQINEGKNLEFLLKMFCFEIDLEPRTDKTLHRNVLFLSHARKLLRQNIFTEKSDDLFFCIAYLHCAIGSTLLLKKTDMETAHVHLVKSKNICLRIVNEESNFTIESCIALSDKTEKVVKPTTKNIEKIAKSMFQKHFDEVFVWQFVLGIRRRSHDVDAIKMTATLEVSNNRYLNRDEYNTLIEKKCAMPITKLKTILLAELLLRILINNGRVLNELVYVVAKKYQQTLRETCNIELYFANEFCKFLNEKCEGFQLFVCLENDRTGRMFMRWSETDVSDETFDNDIECYEKMIKQSLESFGSFLNFGVLMLSDKFKDRHLCICRRMLLRFLQRKYENTQGPHLKKKIFEKGRKIIETLRVELEKREKENRRYPWLAFPLFHIQCAKFLLLSGDEFNVKEALTLFQKATKLEESRGVFWTRYIHEGYHGSYLCLQKLQRENEAKKMIKTIKRKYPGKKNTIQQIKNMKYEFWC